MPLWQYIKRGEKRDTSEGVRQRLDRLSNSPLSSQTNAGLNLLVSIVSS